MIRFEDVILGYNANPVVKIPSLHIQVDERVVLLGSSGSGKSTLLRTVAGFEAPMQGSLFLEGKCVSKDAKIIIPPYRRNIGMVFQDLAL